MRGMKPAGVMAPLVVKRMMRSPIPADKRSASSRPSTMPYDPGTSELSEPSTTNSPMPDAASSAAGSIPRNCTPAILSVPTAMPCPSTNGAVARTSELPRAMSSSPRQSSRRPSMPLIDACDTTLKIRFRTSYSKPLITDETIIKTATAKAMPITEIREINDTNRFLFCERRYRSAMDNS